MRAHTIDLEQIRAKADELLEQLMKEQYVLALLAWVRDHEDDPRAQHISEFVLDRLPFGVEQIGELDELIEAGSQLWAEYHTTLRALDPQASKRAARIALETLEQLTAKYLPAPQPDQAQQVPSAASGYVTPAFAGTVPAVARA